MIKLKNWKKRFFLLITKKIINENINSRLINLIVYFIHYKFEIKLEVNSYNGIDLYNYFAYYKYIDNIII
jgi:hypothetical protein